MNTKNSNLVSSDKFKEKNYRKQEFGARDEPDNNYRNLQEKYFAQDISIAKTSVSNHQHKIVDDSNIHNEKMRPFYQKLLISDKAEIMGRNISISLGDHFEKFVDSKVAEGRFKNAREVIRAGLRLLEEEEAKITALQNAIDEGIASGFVKNFNPQKHLEKLKSTRKKNV
jgi:antitoxin ParD1/3/4